MPEMRYRRDSLLVLSKLSVRDAKFDRAKRGQQVGYYHSLSSQNATYQLLDALGTASTAQYVRLSSQSTR